MPCRWTYRQLWELGFICEQDRGIFFSVALAYCDMKRHAFLLYVPALGTSPHASGTSGVIKTVFCLLVI